jgi:hypothetical protein
MVLNILKFTLQKEKKRIFIFKYCKIDVKSAATLIFAATLITAPTVHSYIHSLITFEEALLHLHLFSRLSEWNLPGVPSRDSNSGLHYCKPAHCHLSYAAPY